MRDYHLHEIDAHTFELISIKISARLLGVGVTGFSSGPDGGRDGKFRGTAKLFPSEASPWSGSWVIQAKHTGNPMSMCSDKKFIASFKSEEVPRIRRLSDEGEAENYLLFTNRRKSADSHMKLEAVCKDALGHNRVGILGVEDITRHLDALPDVVRMHLPQNFRGPLRFSPQELAALIEAFSENHFPEKAPAVESDFTFIALERKNELNRVSEELAHSIVDDSEPYFGRIDDFLSKPQNTIIRSRYYALTNEIKQKLIAERATENGLAEALADVYEAVTTRSPELAHNRRLITVFLHYMYASCDIGKRQ